MPDPVVEILDFEKRVSRSDPRGLLVRFEVSSDAAITRIAFQMEYDEPPLIAEFPLTGRSDGRYVRAMAFKPVRTGSFHFTLTARDQTGRSGSARSSQPVDVTEDPVDGDGGIPAELEQQRGLVEEVRNELYPELIGKPLNSLERQVRIAKGVASRLAHLGVGLVAAKPGSENHAGATPSVPEGYTTDAVALASGWHWDIAIDGGGLGAPDWRLIEEQNNAAIIPRWRPAVQP